MLDFFQSPVTQTVLIALNQGFLVTLELFFVTLIGRSLWGWSSPSAP